VALAILEADPLPAIQSVRAAADVTIVDEGNGFLASVLVTPDGLPVARLDRSIEGASYEGTVLRWTMLHTTGAFGFGYFVYLLVA
jgi:hypothetical protein